MGVTGWLYRTVLLLHILTVVVGFGAFIANASYARLARQRGGAEGLAISQASTAVTRQVALGAIYAVPLFGILLVVLSDGIFGFGDPWVSLSFLLYIVAVALLVAVVLPAQRRADQLGASLVAGSAGGAGAQSELDALGRKLAASSGAFNLLFVVLLALMIFKPGS
ncbi:MAG TPA: DUF2269 family protein [Acidimicrobiales bacterium]|jgi:uncharacterized membrane protein|nr:DUF2269 family protein [Acidimicrobiales bacterium]